MITNLTLLLLLLIAQCIFSLGAAGVLFRRQGLAEPLTRALILYTLTAGVWALLQAGGQALSARGYFSAEHLTRLSLYEGLVMTGVFIYLSQAFLRLDIDRRWWPVGAGGLTVCLLLELDLVPFQSGWVSLRPQVITGLLIVGCAAATGLNFWLTLKAGRRAQQPLHQNRILHWVMIFGLTLIGNSLSFARLAVLGNIINLVTLPLLLYTTLSHHLRDIRQMIKRSITYLTAAVVVALVYFVLFAAMETLVRPALQLTTWRRWLGLAFISALLLGPISLLGQKVAQRLLSRREYKPSQILSEYGLSISNILDLEKLSTVAIGLISEAMEIKHGTLFVVYSPPETAPPEGAPPPAYRLRGVRGIGALAPPEGSLSATSPVALYLRDEHRPLTQYDIDLLPRFRDLPTDEREWFSCLEMDVYVPIYTKTIWIGLLGLGPKLSRNRYFDDDLALLSIFADHTAVALENARLVEGLQQAYADLDEASHLLTQLDRTKTEFINIISHELGTPLMHLDSYNQLMHDDPLVQNSADLQDLMRGMEKGIRRMYEIVEAMLDIAKLDTHSLEIQPRHLPILEPIVAVCEELKAALTMRRLALEIKNLRPLPPLPADPAALRKVFHHLILNAIKYTPDGGKITISGVKVEASAPPPPAPRPLPPGEEGLLVTVADTGIGIDPHNLELIFLKFYQTGEVNLHSTDRTKFKGGGPGLGLTIARGLIEAHGGQVWAESTGCDEQRLPGSCFHIYLPLRRPEPESGRKI